jgi:hypothetical protein
MDPCALTALNCHLCERQDILLLGYSPEADQYESLERLQTSPKNDRFTCRSLETFPSIAQRCIAT